MDRDPTDHPGGIPYKLLAEACIPSINVDDVGAIFEEHRVCKNLSVWQHTNQVNTILIILNTRCTWHFTKGGII